jgi:DMSO/TMAO reductase YedYZ molybdopterin-dependent catalytic subunit
MATTTKATKSPATTPRTAARTNERSRDLAAAIAGAVAGAAGIAVAELIAGIITGAPSLIISMGDLVIRNQPPGAKDFVVNLFGTNDKLALNILILLVAILIAAGIGVLGRRNWTAATVGLGVVAVVLAFAALQEPLVAPIFAVLTPAISFAVSVQVLQRLLRIIDPPSLVAPAPAGPGTPRPAKRPVAEMPDWSRRNFLITSGSIAVASVAVGVLGRALLNRQPVVPTSETPVPVPSAGGAAAPPPLPPTASFSVPGITPIVMPNNQFYRIDTALIIPRVDVSTWTLRVDGMVNKELSFTYDQLKALGLFEQYVTIACVSNHVGENLVGNAKWTGVHLRDVLSMAGIQQGATQIVGRSVDGFTVGFPTEWALDESRDPMIAIAMNDALLPAEHGYPARLIVPGLYGYVSATKWVAEIELTTLEAFDAYWVPLGWAKEAPILTQSRIDVPQSGASVPAGRVQVAGVAWAPDRGVSKVELKVDEGDWQPAMLSTPISKATWVQWLFPWQADKGNHVLEVRATDGTGVVQTAEVSDPAPDGARGHHTIGVTVT